MRIELFKDNKPRTWSNWFAWRPVFVDECLIWLETIERKWIDSQILLPCSSMDGWYDYRLKDNYETRFAKELNKRAVK